MSASVRTALVLGGGGVSGIAWEIGVIAGLERAGVTLARADRFIGTSAGSVVGTQLASGVDSTVLFTRQLDAAKSSKEIGRPYSQAAVDAKNVRLMEKVNGDVVAARKTIGAFALRSETPSTAERRAIIASRLDHSAWPKKSLELIAVDARSGEHVALDSQAGLPLADAVMASCAVPGVWPVVDFDGRALIDGGIRSMTNADLALGSSHVVVLSPLGYSDGNPISGHLRNEVALLEAAGCFVDVILPDEPSQAAVGDNVLDPARTVPAATAGFDQGIRTAALLHSYWRE